MKSKELIDKYKVLYKSGIETVIFLDLAKEEDFTGCSDKVILASEKEDGIEYPASICAYLQTFGVICNLQDEAYSVGKRYSRYSITRELLSMRQDWTNSKTIKEYLKEQDFRINFDEYNQIEGEYTPRMSEVMDIAKINIFLVELGTDIYHFYDSSTDNPEVFYYVRPKGVVSNFVSVTDTYRRSIFYLICKYAPYGYVYHKVIDKDTPRKIFNKDCVPEKEWLKHYSKILQDISFQKLQELNQLRDEYYILNQEQEEKEDRILTIDEFETNFLKYVASK